PARDYDLAATLTSGQAFRWQLCQGWWEGVIGSRWVCLRAEPDLQTGAGAGSEESPSFPLSTSHPSPACVDLAALASAEPPASAARRRPAQQGSARRRPGLRPPSTRRAGRGQGEGCGRPSVIIAETATPTGDWGWLADYFQVELNLADVLGTFPDDGPMRAAVAACRGLRLLRQDPWECLASFILSSTKQIVQIQQIVARLCEQFGERLVVPQSHQPAYSFPLPDRIAGAGESELRACKMGFRAPNLRIAARRIAEGEVDLSRLAGLPTAAARAELMLLPGVGRKIADCVLLFAYGFQDAFPVDVWVLKALRRLYFPGRDVAMKRLQEFAATHFGPHAGYAQQYLFHYARVHAKLKE